MHIARILTGTFAALTLTVGAAVAAPAGMTFTDGHLVDANGMTLYTFDKDEPNTSNCYDQCATNWPPVMAADDAEAEGDFTLVERTDGGKQWAYDGDPLYLWIQDKAPGDATGDGVGGVWHVIAE